MFGFYFTFSFSLLICLFSFLAQFLLYRFSIVTENNQQHREVHVVLEMLIIKAKAIIRIIFSVKY